MFGVGELADLGGDLAVYAMTASRFSQRSTGGVVFDEDGCAMTARTFDERCHGAPPFVNDLAPGD
jgi:hypothetical protein